MCKRVSGILIFLFMAAYSCSAQESRSLIGFHAGAGIVSVRGNEIIGRYHAADLRLAVGADIKYKLKKGFYMLVQLNYDQKGSAIKKGMIYDNLGNEIGYASGANKMNYIALPILFGKEFGKKTIVNLHLGIFSAIMISQKNITHGDNFPESTENNIELFHKADFGLSGGAGVILPLKKNLALSFQLINHLGLINTSDAPVYNGGTIKTNSFNITAGILFEL